MVTKIEKCDLWGIKPSKNVMDIKKAKTLTFLLLVIK